MANEKMKRRPPEFFARKAKRLAEHAVSVDELGDLSVLRHHIGGETDSAVYPYSTEGERELASPNMQLKFRYSSLSTEDRQRISIDSGSLHAWRKVDGIVWTVGEDRIAFDDHIPPEYAVYFFPGAEYRGGFLNEKLKSIYIPEDITSPMVLITLLHEIGHVHDNLSKQRGDAKNQAAGTFSELQSEREATAFALNALRPILRKNPALKDEVMLFMKNLLLGDYAKRSLEQPTMHMSQGDIEWLTEYD